MDIPSKHHFLRSVVAAHGPQLIRFFASQFRDRSEAEDLVQEVYLRILKLERPDLIRSAKAYVYTIAANIAYEHRLKRSSRPLHVPLDDAPADTLLAEVDSFTTTTPEEAVYSLECVRELLALLSELSPKVRAALIWAHRDGYTYAEIGERLSVPKNRVKKYLARALAHCRSAMTLEAAAS